MRLYLLSGGVDRTHLQERKSADGRNHQGQKNDDRKKFGADRKPGKHENIPSISTDRNQWLLLTTPALRFR